jgi:hypothetical protein
MTISTLRGKTARSTLIAHRASGSKASGSKMKVRTSEEEGEGITEAEKGFAHGSNRETG